MVISPCSCLVGEAEAAGAVEDAVALTVEGEEALEDVAALTEEGEG